MTLPADSLAGGHAVHRGRAARAAVPAKRRLERERQVVHRRIRPQRVESRSSSCRRRSAKRLYPGQWSRKNIIGDREVILTVTPAKMREIQRKYYVPNNSALIVTGDVNPDSVFALAEKTSATGRVARTRSRPIPFRRYPGAARRAMRVIIEQPVGAVTVLIQWQGPSVRQGPEGHVRRGRLLRRAQPARLDASAAPGRHRPVAVDRRELLHARPGRADHDQWPDDAGQAEGARSPRCEAEIQRFTEPGYITKEAARSREGPTRGELGVRARAGLGLQRTRSASGGAWPTSSTTWGTWTTWRSRAWRTFALTRRSTSSESRA